MKQFSLILMIGAFLWSTSGIGVLMHYCEGKLKHASFFGMTERDACHAESEMTCHGDQPKACCLLKVKLQESQHDGCSSPDKDCCDDQFFFLKIAEEFLSLNSINIDLDIENQIASFILLETKAEADFFQPNYPPFRQHPPPPKLVRMSILHQQFRL